MKTMCGAEIALVAMLIAAIKVDKSSKLSGMSGTMLNAWEWLVSVGV